MARRVLRWKALLPEGISFKVRAKLTFRLGRKIREDRTATSPCTSPEQTRLHRDPEIPSKFTSRSNTQAILLEIGDVLSSLSAAIMLERHAQRNVFGSRPIDLSLELQYWPIAGDKSHHGSHTVTRTKA